MEIQRENGAKPRDVGAVRANRDGLVDDIRHRGGGFVKAVRQRGTYSHSYLVRSEMYCVVLCYFEISGLWQ